MSPYTFKKIKYAPISNRYWEEGCEATIDTNTNHIRLGGSWFPLDDRYIFIEE